MNRIKTRVNPGSESYRENADKMIKCLDRFGEMQQQVCGGGSNEARQRHLQRGKLLVRERISQLLDEGEEFLELSSLAANGLYQDQVPCAGIVTGIGRIHQRDVMLIANDATVKGGTYYPMTAKKHLRAQEIAAQHALPCIYLVDSGGAYLPMQDEVFPDKEHFGRIFYNQARMSAQGIPQIAVVMGSCTAGGAYVPAMSDETVIVKNQGTIFLGGPPLVKAATGERIDAQQLGGSQVHTEISGVVDHLADDDPHALQITRDIIANLPPSTVTAARSQAVEEPAYPQDELYGIIPRDGRVPYEVREVIARLVDGSRFHEFKALYGQTLVCGFARIDGYPVGLIANNGILFSESALKATHFIQLCNKRHTPLVFLQNVFGFMVGRKYEHQGITKDGAKMVMAVACSEVPMLTVIIGGSYGAGNYAMCGRAYGPRFLWSWPNARISVMGGDMAAELLSSVRLKSAEASGDEPQLADIAAFKAGIQQQFEEQSDPFYATARIWDDGIIEPARTRQVLARALSICAARSGAETRYGIFRT